MGGVICRTQKMSPRTDIKVTRPSSYAKRFLPLLFNSRKVHRICFMGKDGFNFVVIVILIDGRSYLVRDGPTRWWANLDTAMVRGPPPNWDLGQRQPWKTIFENFRKDEYRQDYGGLMRDSWVPGPPIANSFAHRANN